MNEDKTKENSISSQLLDTTSSEKKYTEPPFFKINFWDFLSSALLVHFGDWWKRVSESIPDIYWSINLSMRPEQVPAHWGSSIKSCQKEDEEEGGGEREMSSWREQVSSSAWAELPRGCYKHCVVQHQQLHLLLPQRQTLIYSFVYWWRSQILKLTHCKRVFSAVLNQREKKPEGLSGWINQ